jgi:glycosyltransferase involved in cell wall biosynthesis
MLPVRSYLNKEHCPIVGVTHSLHSVALLPWLLVLLLSELQPHDAVMCTSAAGRRVLENIFSLLNNALECSLGARRTALLQLPVIPIGVRVNSLPSADKQAARQYLSLSQDAVVLLYFGRFSATNKCDLAPLLLTFGRSLKSTNIILILAGDDTQHKMAGALEKLAGELACGDRLHVFPNPDYVQKQYLFSAADIFVSPSDNVQETFGITIAEAMTAGLPVVASDWNGYRELVVHGETGFLVPTYLPRLQVTNEMAMSGIRLDDGTLAQTTVVDLAALERYLRLLIGNRELRATMGRSGRERALRCFDWKVIIKQYEELWNSLLEKGSSLKETTECSRYIHGFASYSYLSVFGHYPTGVLADQDMLQLSPGGKRWLTGDRASSLESSDIGFNVELSRAIALCLNQCGSQTIGGLLSTLSNELEKEIPVRLNLARLIKYGLVKLHRSQIEAPGKTLP